MASTAVQSGLQLYLRSINESPLLTADEEKQLSRRIQMRSFPEIHFELDDSIEKAFKVTNEIDKLARERKAREAKASSSAEATEDKAGAEQAPAAGEEE